MTEMLQPLRNTGLACLPGCETHTGGHSTGDEHAECVVRQPIGNVGTPWDDTVSVGVTLVRDWDSVGSEISVTKLPTSEVYDPDPVVMDVAEARTLARMLNDAADIATMSVR